MSLTASAEATAFLWPINERLMPAIKINGSRAKSCRRTSYPAHPIPPRDLQWQEGSEGMDGWQKALQLLENVRLMKFLFNQRSNFLWQHTHTVSHWQAGDRDREDSGTCWVYDKVASPTHPFSILSRAKCSAFTASIYLSLCATQSNATHASSGRWRGFPRLRWCLLSAGSANGHS